MNDFDEYPNAYDGPEDLRTRFSITPLLDTEINVGAMGLVGLTPEVDHELRLDVTSAVVGRFLGVSPRTARKHVSEAPEHEPRDELIRSLCRMHIYHYDRFYQAMGVRDEAIGVFAFDLAMVRSRASIELMLICARQGFLIEPCLIGRSLMEQFAYALRVWDTEDDEVVFGSKPQSLIRYLNELNPKSGRAYGLLSQLSHYDPKLHISFIGGPQKNWKDEESGTVVQRSWRFKIASLAWVFFILDLKFKAFRRCYGAHANFRMLEPLTEPISDVFEQFFEGVDEPAVGQVRRLIT